MIEPRPAAPGRPPTDQRPPPNAGRVLLALIVIALGVVFLLDAAGVLDASRTIDRWWPLAVIALGGLQMLEQRRVAFGPLLIVGVGTALLLHSTDAVEGDVWQYVWPIAIIVIGIGLLTRLRGAGAQPGDEDTVVASGILGGPDIANSSQSFRGASLTAILGGVKLDLRGAHPAPEGARITATAALGGIDIIVPRGWRISTSSTPLFGGVEDKTEPDPDLAADAPRLHVDALAIFGGIDIKHAKG